MEETCENCNWWDTQIIVHVNNMGNCMVRPPNAYPDINGVIHTFTPVTNRTFYCGCFKPKFISKEKIDVRQADTKAAER